MFPPLVATPSCPRAPTSTCILVGVITGNHRSVFLGIAVSLLVSQYLLRKEKSAVAARNAFGEQEGLDRDVEVTFSDFLFLLGLVVVAAAADHTDLALVSATITVIAAGVTLCPAQNPLR